MVCKEYKRGYNTTTKILSEFRSIWREKDGTYYGYTKKGSKRKIWKLSFFSPKSNPCNQGSRDATVDYAKVHQRRKRKGR